MAESMHEKMMRLHGAGEGMKPSHSRSDMKKATFEVALKGKKQIAEGTFAFTFEKPEKFKFKAGQHIRMTLIDPPETDEEGDSRFLSIASTPQDTDLVFALRMRDTAFKRVLASMQPGDKVRIQVLLDVPHGAFALHDDASRPAVYIVGGIGIVPAYSMIKDATEKRLPHKLTLIYSNRRPEDTPFLAELENLAKQNSNFTFIPTMTEPEKSSRGWQGKTGRIDQPMLEKYIDNFNSPIFYISGLPEMVSAMKTLLINAGANKDNIKAEEFAGFNLNELPEDRGKRQKPMRYILLTTLVLLMLAMIVSHVWAANSVTTSFSDSLLKNPLFYITIAFMVILAKYKFKHVAKFIQKRKQ